MSERLDELRAAHLPRLTWRDVLTPAEGAEPPTADEQAALDAYFGAFVAPQKNEDGHLVCVSCRNRIRGGIEGFILGGAPDSTTMEWGIVHGECFCIKCRWPARAYHFDIGCGIKRLAVTLQYHPDEVSTRTRKASEAEQAQERC